MYTLYIIYNISYAILYIYILTNIAVAKKGYVENQIFLALRFDGKGLVWCGKQLLYLNLSLLLTPLTLYTGLFIQINCFCSELLHLRLTFCCCKLSFIVTLNIYTSQKQIKPKFYPFPTLDNHLLNFLSVMNNGLNVTQKTIDSVHLISILVLLKVYICKSEHQYVGQKG